MFSAVTLVALIAPVVPTTPAIMTPIDNMVAFVWIM